MTLMISIASHNQRQKNHTTKSYHMTDTIIMMSLAAIASHNHNQRQWEVAKKFTQKKSYHMTNTIVMMLVPQPQPVGCCQETESKSFQQINS